MRVLDADGHIFEPEAMFATLDAEFAPRRPVAVSLPEDSEVRVFNQVYLIESKIAPRISGRGTTFPGAFPPSPAAQSRVATLGDQTLEDVEARLAGMEHFGIQEQVIYPTLFLAR
jgi:hypothetical protein